MDKSALTGAVIIDIDAELSCWRELEYTTTSELVFLFHEWEPAIRVGIHAYLTYPDRDFESIEPVIVAAYQRIRGRSRIPWSRAAPAARRVWQKLQNDEDVQRAGWEYGSAPRPALARA
ncbi:MAG: hypothetical protein JWL98_1563 [Xanthomonadaceae bacterium]|nr:hypothetical protein [Xanthomonadaceae bacterium]